MRLFFLITFFFLALSIKGQTFKPNANQKEIIEYIQALLNQASATLSNTEDGTLIQTFDGTTMKKVMKLSLVFQDIHSNIDWSSYSGVTKVEGKSCIYIKVKFKGSNIIYESICSRPADDKRCPNKLESYKIKYDDDEFSFSIPYGLNNKISELEIAFKRLQSLVSGGIKLPINYTTKIKEIQGKPSFYETLQYINNFLNTQESKDNNEFKCMSTYQDREQYLTIDEYMYIDLFSKYDDYYWARETKTYEYDIPLDLVENIIIRSKGFSGLDCYMVFLQFAKNGEESKSEYHLPLFLVNSNHSISKIENENIFKAFNHLRKMLGAKDPVKF